MRFLFCCKFYHPSRGGIQEVMRQIAERMVSAGHGVTVATTRLPERDFEVWNGVRIEGFDIWGNLTEGLHGEIDRYQAFLKNFPADTVMINNVQQRTFDGSWEVLDEIRARKVLIPGGFWGLNEPAYHGYFERLPPILRKFDRLIFHAERYRDIDFAKSHGLSAVTIIPNGASELEFAVPPDPTFRARFGIPPDDIVILTVGSPIEMKGHTELAAAFAQISTRRRGVTLMLNGLWPKPLPRRDLPGPQTPPSPPQSSEQNSPQARAGFVDRALDRYRGGEAADFVARIVRSMYWRERRALTGSLAALVSSLCLVMRQVGARAHALLQYSRPSLPRSATIDDLVAIANTQQGKRVLKTYLSRNETVQAFLNADLFVFASNNDYSPLVLFESAAAGLPFLTVPVGNAEEIVRWTEGGVLCPADQDSRGYTRVDPMLLAKYMYKLINSPDLRRQLGEAGRIAWQREFNWGSIAKRYEAVLTGDINKN